MLPVAARTRGRAGESAATAEHVATIAAVRRLDLESRPPSAQRPREVLEVPDDVLFRNLHERRKGMCGARRYRELAGYRLTRSRDRERRFDGVAIRPCG